jgi:hypothetical protein
MIHRRIGTILLVLATLVPRAQAETKVHVVARPDTNAINGFYAGNRVPLALSPLIRLPVGAIVPKGWLRHQLELESQGMTGRLPEVSQWTKYDNNGWVTPKGREDWEETTYGLRGFGDLGYVLGDEWIIHEARHWIEGIMAAQQPDGWFGH